MNEARYVSDLTFVCNQQAFAEKLGTRISSLLSLLEIK